jgi:predicted Zn-dependent protease
MESIARFSVTALFVFVTPWPVATAQASQAAQQVPAAATATGAGQQTAWHQDFEKAAAWMQTAHFAEAMPILRQLVAAGDRGYPVRFNLALCDVGTGEYADAVVQLNELLKAGIDTAPMHNLLAQAYLGEGLHEAAWEQIQRAARMAPTDERMFALLMDACTSHNDYALGLRVASLGLTTLPDSARLHYGNALFLARLDRLDEARPEFARAAKLGTGTDIGALASVQSSLYDDRYAAAAATARAAIAAGDGSAEMLALLGDVLLQGGAAPGQPAFAEARTALESAAAKRPQDATTQIALGSLYLRESAWAQAVPHLEAGRLLEPGNPAIYARLATAYRRLGNRVAAEQCTQKLAALLQARQSAREQSTRK